MGEAQLTPTAEELQAYHMVKGLIGGIIDLGRVKVKKVQSYCGVLLDDETKPLCWLHFGPRGKSLNLFYPDTGGRKRDKIQNLDDLHKFQVRFQATVRHYESR